MKKVHLHTLSIIIVTYNNEKTIDICLESIYKEINDTEYEIIIVDNGSTDETIKKIKSWEVTINNKKNRTYNIPPVTYIYNKQNIGFGKANNQGIQKARGKYILLLNPDVIISSISFKKIIDQFNSNENLAVLTINLIRPDGTRDMACHRGFPTLWRSFCYFTKLEKLFSFSKSLSKIFGGYHLLHYDLTSKHEIDSPTAAFYLTTKKILQEVNGFDEDYFMYGEDLDLSYRIKQKGYSILFDPTYKAIHIKYQSGLESSNLKSKKRTKKYFYDAMRIFYKKHYSSNYPMFMNNIIYAILNSIKFYYS